MKKPEKSEALAVDKKFFVCHGGHCRMRMLRAVDRSAAKMREQVGCEAFDEILDEAFDLPESCQIREELLERTGWPHLSCTLVAHA